MPLLRPLVIAIYISLLMSACKVLVFHVATRMAKLPRDIILLRFQVHNDRGHKGRQLSKSKPNPSSDDNLKTAILT